LIEITGGDAPQVLMRAGATLELLRLYVPAQLNSIEPPWYGPVCPVVWEGWHREVSPIPINVYFPICFTTLTTRHYPT
jgi:hypothetical protein